MWEFLPSHSEDAAHGFLGYIVYIVLIKTDHWGIERAQVRSIPQLSQEGDFRTMERSTAPSYENHKKGVPMSTNILVDLSNALAEAAAKAGASTVLVNARQRMPASGIAIQADLVLAAEHTIEREEDITVILPDGTELSARLAGRDPGSDLAILRLEKPLATPAEIVTEEARVGQIVLAVGRPATEGIQASLGVISAIAGPAHTGSGGVLERYIRTDTTPFPGFSGGPLVDSSGRVVGLNTSGFGHGAAITIPASLAWKTAETLVTHGHVQRGYLGIRSQGVEIPAASQKALGRSHPTGLLLVGVESDSPAGSGGLMVGDILVGIAGHEVLDHDQLMAHLNASVVGQPTPIEVLRGGQPVTVNVIVGER
jgi:S1-C subfamily serine protease